MQQSVLVSVFLPVALGIIMLGLGLSLVLDDFKRIVKYPKAIGIALICQMILLPIMCFFIAQGFGLQPALAVGLMLLAASPGGATANLYSHLSNGDVALNITLTAVNSILALFTLPLVINLSLAYFMESDQYVPMQFIKVAEVFVVVLTPVAIGMLIRHKAPNFAAKMNKPVKILSALFLILIIAAVTIKEKQLIFDYAGNIGLPILTFNILSMAVGYFVPLLFSLKKKQAIAMGMEIGIHNGTLGIYIALSVLGSSQMSIPSALYGLLMFFTAAAFGFLVNIGKKTKEVEEATV